MEEYARAFQYLEILARPGKKKDDLKIASEALSRRDFLLASTQLLRSRSGKAKTLLRKIEAEGKALLAEAEKIDAKGEPGRAYEAWWRIMTQFHRFPALASKARAELASLEKLGARALYKARREWFRKRGTRGTRPARRAPATPRTPRRNTPLKRKRKIRPPDTRAGTGPWAFDHYLRYDELAGRMRELARRFPGRARLLTLGKSVQGRPILGLELTDRSAGRPKDKPATYLQGLIHGNEVSSMTATLYMAWICAANPFRKRSVDRLMRDNTLYIVPAVNPDGGEHYLAEPHSSWRPRANFRPFDDDGDGRIDEDGPEDLDGDGEIGLMYRPDPAGPYVLKDGRLVRGKGGKTYTLVGREGLDDDKDGRFSEDPPGGVDLNRNFPTGFRSRKGLGGWTGPSPLSEPETRAVAEFVEAHPNISLFLDYHNAAKCLFYWDPDPPGKDGALYEEIASRGKEILDYEPRRLLHGGAGLSIAWAYGSLGIPAFIVELEACRGAPEAYYRNAWGGRVFLPPRPFRHPQLGEILLGNDYRKIPRRNPHPKDIPWQAARNFEWVKKEVQGLPRLTLVDPRIEWKKGAFTVTGKVENEGRLPTDTDQALRLGKAFSIRVTAKGAAVSGTLELGSLGPGEERPFRVLLEKPGRSATLFLRHPRAGLVELPVLRPPSPTIPIRRHYTIEEGYATPDRAIPAETPFFHKGRPIVEKGPAFKLAHRKNLLRVAVLLGEWKDKRHSVPASEFQKAFFSRHAYRGRSFTGQRVYGSLADFYEEMSYGKLRVTGRVFDWVEFPGHYAEYRGASFGSDIVQRRLEEAVLQKYGPKALDGFDGYAFVWAGNPVKRTSALWPMKLRLKNRPSAAAFKMGEFYHGAFAAIGVPCHEIGHTFGVGDKYGLGATPNPLGPWCLMGKGTHGGEPSREHRPFHLCAWCKSVIGWVRPVAVDPSRPQKLALRPILYGPGECYRILLKPDGSEYILLENRRREGFFTDLPSPGLAVLKVGPNDRPASPWTRVQLLPAHGLPPLRRGVIAHPEAVAWPQEGKTSLQVQGVRLSHIRLVDDVIYFEVGPAGE